MRQSDSVRTLQQQQWRVLACGLQTGVWLIAAVVLSRRISGDASGLTTQWAACLVGSVAIAVSVLTTSFLKGDNPRASSADDELLPEALSLLPGVMLGLALLPAGSGGGLTALLGLFVIGFGVQFGVSTSRRTGEHTRAFDRPLQTSSEGLGSEARTAGANDTPGGHADQPRISDDTEPEEALPARSSRRSQPDEGSDSVELSRPLVGADRRTGESDTLTELADDLAATRFGSEAQQWMSRSRQDGYDVVEGEVQIDFVAGQRVVVVHLPFSPPLAGTPEFECEGLDQVELSFRTTARHTYGVRVEVSRPATQQEPATTRIGWAASAATCEEAAAVNASAVNDAA